MEIKSVLWGMIKMARIIPAKYLVGITNVNNTLLGIGAIRTGGVKNTFVGMNAGLVNTADGNAFIGYEAGLSNTNGILNTFVGTNAGKNNIAGGANTFLGTYAGLNNITGGANTFVGTYAGSNNTGNDNTFVGVSAGQKNTTNENTFVGALAGQNNTIGSGNVFLGYKAGYNNEVGSRLTFVGYEAGLNNFSDKNTFIGFQTGYTNTSGQYNTFVGGTAGYSNDTGFYNTFVGRSAGYSSLGNDNTFVGDYAGYSNSITSGNTFIGSSVGIYNSGGSTNTFVGFEAGYNNNADNNVFIGYDTGFTNVIGNQNTFVGTGAGYNNEVGNNVFVGYNAGFTNTSGLFNTFIGTWAGKLNVIGQNNTFLGFEAGLNNVSDENTFVGFQAGRANTSGLQNTFIGDATGNLNTTGRNNTFLGFAAGFSNVSGSNNVFLGSKAGTNESGSSKLYISNANTTTPLIGGDFSTPGVTINKATTPISTLDVAGSHSRSFTLVNTSTTLTINHFHVNVDTTAGNLTVTLPSAVITSGRTYYIQKAVAENSVVLATTSGQFINNDLSTSINSQWETLRVISDGFDWISQNFGSISPPGQLKPNITRYTMPGWMVVRADSNIPLTTGMIYYIPFFVATTTTFTELCFVIFSGGSAGNTCDCRIFAWNDGVPGTLILNAGNPDVSGGGTITIAINLTLNRGFYFLAMKPNNLPAVPNFRCVNMDVSWYAPVTGIVTTSVLDINNVTNRPVLTVISAYADPAPAPTGVTVTTPIFFLREN